MTPEQQAQMDKKEVKIIRADNGYMVRCFPEFKVFTSFKDMAIYLEEKLEKEPKYDTNKH